MKREERLTGSINKSHRALNACRNKKKLTGCHRKTVSLNYIYFKLG